jgi:hypothetical protein
MIVTSFNIIYLCFIQVFISGSGQKAEKLPLQSFPLLGKILRIITCFQINQAGNLLSLSCFHLEQALCLAVHIDGSCLNIYTTNQNNLEFHVPRLVTPFRFNKQCQRLMQKMQLKTWIVWTSQQAAWIIWGKYEQSEVLAISYDGYLLNSKQNTNRFQKPGWWSFLKNNLKSFCEVLVTFWSENSYLPASQLC